VQLDCLAECSWLVEVEAGNCVEGYEPLVEKRSCFILTEAPWCAADAEEQDSAGCIITGVRGDR